MMKKLERVSGPAVVGIVLTGALFIVCSVLAILAVIRKLRRKSSLELKSPTTDIQIAVMEKGVGIHKPTTERRRVQKVYKTATIASPPGSSPIGGALSAGYDQQDDTTEGEYDVDEDLDDDDGGSACTLIDEKENSKPPMTFGTLHFSVKYNFEKNALTVVVQRCENLISRTGCRKSIDPYVKLQLLPEKVHRAKTRVLRNTDSPIYNEEFTFFGLNYNQLQGMVIHFAIISFDRYSRDEVLGELLSPLSMIDLAQSDQETSLVKEICTRQKVQSQGRGEVLLSLCYQPATNRLTCVILKAKGLPRKNIMDLADPYMKLYLICNGQRIAKKKTHVKKHTLNPVFNESFVFDLPANIQGLEGVSLELLLLDFDRLTKNEVVGRLELGPNTLQDSAKKQWSDICTSPRRQIAEWHKLQD
ncbi:Synaptotagmin-11 [Hypsibius exemplaris]|uniref:Synaptotagmin-11 n=1 Tax=Hypsibius exemplaris TaxID=2072580 RepID=A0A1W0WTB4_HYPEX|nr:Synaptotagmin-11 [Hypsibius exemplaris]